MAEPKDPRAPRRQDVQTRIKTLAAIITVIVVAGITAGQQITQALGSGSPPPKLPDSQIISLSERVRELELNVRLLTQDVQTGRGARHTELELMRYRLDQLERETQRLRGAIHQNSSIGE